MARLSQIVFQGGSLLTMLVLEMVCFYLIVNFNDAQRAIYLETLSVYTGGVNEKVDNLGSYFNLQERVDSLHKAISELKAQLPESSYLVPGAGDTIRDDSLRQRFTYIPAEAINKSPYGPNNTFIINRGRGDGVERGEGIMSYRSPMGIVTAVSEKHSRVMSLLHRDTRLSVGLQSGAFGTLTWDGQDPRWMILSDMKDYVKVAEGDTVYTTGYSSIFPTGVPVGTVSGKERLAGEGNWRLQIELLRAPLEDRFVYVVNDLFKEDLEAIKSEE